MCLNALLWIKKCFSSFSNSYFRFFFLCLWKLVDSFWERIGIVGFFVSQRISVVILWFLYFSSLSIVEINCFGKNWNTWLLHCGSTNVILVIPLIPPDVSIDRIFERIFELLLHQQMFLFVSWFSSYPLCISVEICEFMKAVFSRELKYIFELWHV